MKRFVLAVALLVSCALLPPERTLAATYFVPSPGTLLQSVTVRGLTSVRVVVYRHYGIKLGVVVGPSRAATLIWSRVLLAAPERLESPGPTGLVDGVVRFAGNTRAQVFAYIARRGGVVSAIAGHTSGIVGASEGVSFHSLTFLARTQDTGHVGSVRYQARTTYIWNGAVFTPARTIRVPDYTPGAYPTPNATVVTQRGDSILLKLEVANTEAERTTGLMNRTSLDPDSGMIFVWPNPVLESFWMENTYIPLSIAFLSANGTVQEIQNMDPLTTTLHTPALPYQYAIEANLGFFAERSIVVGDTFALHLAP